MIYQTLLLALAGAALSTPATVATGLQQKHQALSPRQNRGSFRGTSQNGLQGGACADNMIIFARGTTEAGNVGSISGPPFFQAMAAQVGADNLLVQGVEYPADIPGFLAGGDADGSQLMADLTTQAVADCPGSKVIMSGYSQGAQLVHNAAELMDAAAVSQVAGTVLFGDPSMFVSFSPPPPSPPLFFYPLPTGPPTLDTSIFLVATGEFQ